jgi:hypothetical protein
MLEPWRDSVKNWPILAKVYKISQSGDFTAEGEFRITVNADSVPVPDAGARGLLGLIELSAYAEKTDDERRQRYHDRHC